jgi:hypothetical protein
MENHWDGFIDGVFEGYLGGRIHVLSDGSRWRQEDRTSEYVYRERPKAKLLWNQSTGRMYLDVEGTSSVVLVVKDTGIRGMGGGAF